MAYGYSQYTLDSLTAELSSALSDPTNIFWSRDEIHRAINEFLLYWGALTSYWRERGQFQTVARIGLYDLASQLPALRSRAYTFGQLTKEIQYHFLERPDGVSGLNLSAQFSISQITSALKRARNQFVLDARFPLSLTQGALTWDQATNTWDSYPQTWDALPVGGFPIAAPPSGRASLDQSIALIQRASWTDAPTQITVPLRREDGWAADSYSPGWPLAPGRPFAYSLAEVRPIEMQFIPPPITSGRLDLIYVRTLDLPIADDQSFFVPDEFALAIKWRAIHDLLSSYAESYDPVRAQYALERYNACILATSIFRSVLRVQLNTQTLHLDTLFAIDAGLPYWQTQLGRPSLAGCAYDIVGLANTPSTVFGVTCEVVRSAPLPVAGLDPIQLGREEVTFLFDYCRHILSFKLGGEEFTSTFHLYDNFLRGASQRNKLLSSRARYLEALFNQPKREADVQPAA